MPEKFSPLELRLQKVSEQNPEQRLELLIKLYQEFQDHSPGKTLAYARQAADLAAKMKRVSEQVDAYSMIVRQFERMRDYRHTLENGIAALKICEAAHRFTDYTFFANAVGTAYLYLGDYSEALRYYQEVERITSSMEDKQALSVVINNIGNVYLRLGNYEKALDSYLQALRLKEETGDSQANIINSIGNVYLMMQDFDRALECHEQALGLYRSKGESMRAVQVLNNIGLSYKNLRKFSKAISVFQKALTEASALPYENLTSRTINNLGLLQREMGDHNAALDSFLQSLEMKREQDDIAGLAAAHLNIGQTLMHLQKFIEAENHLREGLDLARSLGSKEMLREGMEQLATLFIREAENCEGIECKDPYRMAYESMKEALELADDIWRSKSSRYLVDMQVRFEIEEHEREAQIYRQKSVELAEANAKLEEANEKLEQLALTDELTGLSNRRDMILNLERELIRSLRSRKAFSVIICDIDHFKQFNDTYGHDCGDYVLKAVSHTMRETIRRQDYVSRWGGEEFLLMLPETALKGGDILAEKLRTGIDEAEYEWMDKKLHISLTFGVAEHRETEEVDDVVKRADEALYAGKRAGRNRVYCYPNEGDEPVAYENLS